MVMTFDEAQPYITELLNRFSDQQWIESGYSQYSGGYAHAEYVEFDGEKVYFTLELGIEDPNIDEEVYTERYNISIENLMSADIGWNEKLKSIDSQ